MKISRVQSWSQAVPLTRPYAIAGRSISAVKLFFVRVTATNGTIGLGSASPAEKVTGESEVACSAALNEENLQYLLGQDATDLVHLNQEIGNRHTATPAARVALEMALYDLLARLRGQPLVDLLGRCHRSLPTSITIGIKPTIEEALAEADEYLSRGFRTLKIKIGDSYRHEVDLLHQLRRHVGKSIQLRVDANLGYTFAETLDFWSHVQSLNLELVEQPVSVDQFAMLADLPPAYRSLVAADESLLNERDARSLVGSPVSCGIFNIKLMKCGGLSTALQIARMGQQAGIDLMWGCMDESVISISAALHTAYACPNTQYLDLDGSFDLARDPARGGFELAAGRLSLLDAPGLGVELSD